MEFEWDEKKRLSNMEKHGINFLDADVFFDGEHIIELAHPGNDGARWWAVGLIDGGYVTTIFTRRGEVMRIISMRSARHEERRRYREVFGG